MKLLAVIVNYRTPEMTLDALDALVRELRSLPAGCRAMVVDNDSADGSFEKIAEQVQRRGWGEVVEVARSARNGGFGYGNNVGLQHGLSLAEPPDYFYLLNSDAFPDPGALRVLVEFLDAHPDVGIAGGYIHGPDGTPHETAFRFPSWVSEFEQPLGIGAVSRVLQRWVQALPIPTRTRQVDWLAGASMLIRREVLEQIGLFDEAFFLYFEETDLCRRARVAGWPTYYVPASSVAHIGSASTGMKDLSRRTPTFYFDSRRHYFRKNHGAAYLWLANLSWVLGFSIGHLRRRLMNRPDPVHRARAFLDFIAYNFGLRGRANSE